MLLLFTSLLQDLVLKSMFDGERKAAKSTQSTVNALEPEVIRSRGQAIAANDAAPAALMSPVDAVSATEESDIGDQGPFLMPTALAADRLETMSAVQRDLAKDGAGEAKQVVVAGVRLIDSDGTENSNIATLRDSAMARIQGGSDGYSVIIHDRKSPGENPNVPCSWSAPLRKGACQSTATSRPHGQISRHGHDQTRRRVCTMFVDGHPAIITRIPGGLNPCAAAA